MSPQPSLQLMPTAFLGCLWSSESCLLDSGFWHAWRPGSGSPRCRYFCLQVSHSVMADSCRWALTRNLSSNR